MVLVEDSKHDIMSGFWGPSLHHIGLYMFSSACFVIHYFFECSGPSVVLNVGFNIPRKRIILIHRFYTHPTFASNKCDILG